MAEGFEPSPRASKRRKTTYGGSRTVLEDGVQVGTPNIQKDQESTSSKENDEPQSTRTSGRTTRRPRRYSASTELSQKPQEKTPSKKPSMKEPPKTAPIPKSILTPSKRRRDEPSKTVVFDENEEAIGEQLGFRDIGSIPKKSKQTSVRKTKKSIELVDQDEPMRVIGSTDAPATTDVEFEDVLADEPEIVPAPPPLSGPDSNDIKLSADPSELVQIKRQVLARLTSRTLSPPSHLESQYTAINTLLTSTVTAGESNSLLLLGPRGSGKSLLIETALSELNRSHSDDFHTVRLNGFFQTDDRLALREIWRQLGREMQVNEDEVDEVSSYADTMASLLSLLSHPDDFATDATAAQGGTDTKKSSKSVVFVLDEFDLFTTHPRQTLLYNLFDIAQSRKAPIAVLGCSTRMDVVDCLEKRVKSRYSHRWIHVPLAKSLSVFQESVEAVLLVDEQDHSGKLLLDTQSTKKQKEYCQRWNEYIKTAFLPNRHTQDLIKEHFYTTKSLPGLFIAIYPLIASISLPSTSNQLSTHSKPPSTTLSTATPPSLTSLLLSLPTLHLSLLTTASRLETIHSLPTINFNLVHAHYTELIDRARTQQTAQTNLAMTSNILSPAVGGGHSVVGNAGGALRLWGQQTCRAAWEDLGRWGLVVPVSSADEGVGAGNEVDSRMCRCDIMLEEVLWGIREKWRDGEGAGSVLGKWCSEI